MFCNTIDGAKTIAILYTLVETARANGVNVYYYLKYLLEKMPAHMDDKGRSFLADMMPWSQAVNDYVKEQKDAVIDRLNLNSEIAPPKWRELRSAG